MRKAFNIIGLMLALLLAFSSCQKAPFLTFTGQKSFTFKDAGGSETITFSCNRAWTVSSSESWLTVSPAKGDANEEGVRVTITCAANTTYNPRNATVTISSEGLTETISVSQDTNYGLMLEPTTFNLTNEAQNIEVEVKANVEYTIEIDDACKDWISQVGTKALSATKYLFGVSENTKYVGREASITFKQKDGSLCGIVKISQRQTDFLEVSPVKDSISHEGGTLKLDVITNIEYKITAKDSPEWIIIGEGSKGETKDGLTTYSHSIEVAENENRTRYAELTVTDGKGVFSKSFLIAQSAGCIEFEDANFKVYCVKNFDTNRDGEISYLEAEKVEIINLSEGAIKSLKGIEYFTRLECLFCSHNQLTSLDLSKNTALKVFYCDVNQLTSLDVSKNTALTHLYCEVNQLTSLDLSKNTALEYLTCSRNQLASLDLSRNTTLKYLSCSRNQLTSLDLSKNAALTDLSCDVNQLTSLDVNKNTALELLNCLSNQLISLDLSKNTALTHLNCGSNQLTSLDVSKNTALKYFTCSSNQLTSLDLSKNTALEYLNCNDNYISNIYVWEGFHPSKLSFCQKDSSATFVIKSGE